MNNVAMSTTDNNKRIRRVLLIEDNDTDSKLIETRVNQLHPDAEILTAKSIFEAYDLYKAKDYDVLLLDLNLPGSFGSGSVSEMQRINKNRNIPVVVLTGYAHENTLSDAIRKGASDIYKKDDLLKPEFEEILAKYLK